MMQREITCIGCPMGCNLIVQIENGEVVNVSGNSCKIGIDHAKKECTNPTRIVTTTFPVLNGIYPRVAVKTAEAIPKYKIEECMKALKDVAVTAPISRGDILFRNIVQTGINIVATQSVAKK
ncbi:NAD(FAD)-dependent dehydrogenase [Sporanaerobium hydrogeniformans]|uniref:NAD(FAD)-dependent dehydrogenase n=1 Tax=Sporanaerobium hydrogeniformans TaxID=3072179 RepID=A0AC61DBA4_9FIRM|nr:DUF1667 domain-containing protein [Sporanaerobium hydrogeniformans]PHV70569.1 NAD(FAD)-dependent dehydrogenase [Sporanaerobium hydrogeniformans]